MSAEGVSSRGPRTSNEIRSWSEDPLTARARSVWTSGDFLPIARSFAPGAEEFIARLGIRPGETVLDVACGTGNLAIPAAKAGARVSGIDIAPNLIAEAHLEARAAGVAVAFEVGDAESLPYVQGQFDTTVTMFGAMFAFRPERAAAELTRVTRPGGRVAMANWTFEGFVGQMLRLHTAVVPPPQGVPSSLEWGKEAMVRARFGDKVSSVICSRRTLELSFPSCSPTATGLRSRPCAPPIPKAPAGFARTSRGTSRNTMWPPTAARRWSENISTFRPP